MAESNCRGVGRIGLHPDCRGSFGGCKWVVLLYSGRRLRRAVAREGGETVGLIIAAAQAASSRGEIARNVQRHLDFVGPAAERGVQLLVFPELSLTGYELEIAREHVIAPESPVLEPLRRAGMFVVAGAPVRGDDGQLHIGALIFRPDGEVSVYTKVHVHSSEAGVFACGSGGEILDVQTVRAALAICADASHPAHAAAAAVNGAQIYAAGVMIDEAGYARKTDLLRRAARTHGFAALMANYSGITGGEVSAGKSAIWTEQGELVAASEGNEEALIVGVQDGGSWTGAVFPV